MEIKKILYLLRPELETLPPSMSQVLVLLENGYEVKVVTTNASEYIRSFLKYPNVEFVTINKKCKIGVGKADKFLDILLFREVVKKAVNSNEYDLIWVGSADTARYCRDILKDKSPMVLNIYELYDKCPGVLKSIRDVAKASNAVVVPEYNRAHILKVWLGLTKCPVVIPNIPRFGEVGISPDTQKIVDELKATNKKIVLYQGWIGKDRDVSRIADALGRMENKDDYLLVLLGKAPSHDTIPYIKSKFENTVHIPYLNPPQHLFVTETAYMGIATYDDSSLNNIFCAPNKIYEYAEKGVPILARDIPGLSSTVGKMRAGALADTDNVGCILKAIDDIDENHDLYVSNLERFLNEYDVNKLVLDIVTECEGGTKNE